MKCSPALPLSLLLLLLWPASAVPAEEELDLTLPYLFLTSGKTAQLQKQLDEAASAGYRVLMAAGSLSHDMQIVLKKVTEPPGSYQYLILGARRESTLEREMNQAAAQGFRALQRSILHRGEFLVVMEKPPNPETRYQYSILSTWRVGNLLKDIHQAIARGWELVFFGDLAIMEKPAGETPAAHLAAPTSEARYRLLQTERTSTMKEELTESATVGYRFWAAVSRGSELSFLMEKMSSTDPPPEYRMVATGKEKNLLRELAQAEAEGFRPLPRSFVVYAKTFGHDIILVLEKVSAPQPPVEYRLLDTWRLSTLRKEFHEAVQQGWQVVDIERGGSNYVLLARPVSRAE